MSTRISPPRDAGSSSPATDDPATKCSGGTPSQPINARTPSASASVAVAYRLTVEADTPTLRAKSANVTPCATRAFSMADASSARSNVPLSLKTVASTSSPQAHAASRSAVHRTVPTVHATLPAGVGNPAVDARCRANRPRFLSPRMALRSVSSRTCGISTVDTRRGAHRTGVVCARPQRPISARWARNSASTSSTGGSVRCSTKTATKLDPAAAFDSSGRQDHRLGWS